MEGICITYTDNKFEAAYYDLGNRPLNHVLIKPRQASLRNNYLLINTGVTVSWMFRDKYDKNYVLQVTYNDTILWKKNNITNIQLVIDVLHKFNNISKKELELLVQKAQQDEKSALEITIEALRAEKAKLEEQIQIYKLIQTKKEELKVLLDKLNEEYTEEEQRN